MGRSKSVLDGANTGADTGPLRVIATQMGTYGGGGTAPRLRQPGEAFTLHDASHFSRRWMVLEGSPEAAGMTSAAIEAAKIDSVTGERLATGATGEQLALALAEVKTLRAENAKLASVNATLAAQLNGSVVTEDAEAPETQHEADDGETDTVPASDTETEDAAPPTPLARRRRSTTA